MTSDRPGTLAEPSHVSHPPGDIGTDDSLVARARALEPIIRQHVETTERERRLAGPVLQAMREAGLFRMFTPRALGGLQVDPLTVARGAEEIASVDSAAAWALQAGNTGSWWAGRFPESGIAELYAEGPDLLMAASFSPPHRADAVPGSYRFTGRGTLASTIHDSPWVLMTGIVFDGEQARTASLGAAPRVCLGGAPGDRGTGVSGSRARVWICGLLRTTLFPGSEARAVVIGGAYAAERRPAEGLPPPGDTQEECG